MPVYEYQCETCQNIIEVQQGLSDKPLTTCSACKGTLKKLISRSSFQLKGGGWYSDGYSSSGSACTPCQTAGSDSTPACAAKESCACKCG